MAGCELDAPCKTNTRPYLCAQSKRVHIAHGRDKAFPGFFVFRNETADRASGQMSERGVADHTWVEVVRIARLDDRYIGTTHPLANQSSIVAEQCLVGQIWFWVARGSGVWINVGRSLVLPGPFPRACEEAYAEGYDTVQLTRSYGLTYELIDCRGMSRPDAWLSYEPACPPSHIELRAGMPTPRDAPALNGLAGTDSPCACDSSYDFLNCFG
jgi:hypothetical protein